MEASPRTYDLTVAYRIYPGLAKVPPVLAQDKLKLSELCLKSFRQGLGSLRARLIVLLDNCPPAYAELFRRYFPDADLELVPLAGSGNLGTFQLQIQRLLEQSWSETVYFAEDDYFYLPGSMETLLAFHRAHPDIHFATTYDHLDYHTSRLHQHPHERRMQGPYRWRTAGSTCLTFLTSKTVLRQTRQVLESYGRRNPDAGVWFSLTKYIVTNPVGSLLTAVRGKNPVLTTTLAAWWFCWRQILSGPTWKLWAPEPTLSTHMERNYLPPGFDWPKLLNQAIREL